MCLRKYGNIALETIHKLRQHFLVGRKLPDADIWWHEGGGGLKNDNVSIFLKIPHCFFLEVWFFKIKAILKQNMMTAFWGYFLFVFPKELKTDRGNTSFDHVV